MDFTAERHFVETFVRKSMRKRLIYELTTPGKRYDGVSRFCHGAKDLLEPSKILLEGDNIDRLPEFKRFIRQHNESCYVLSPALPLEGQTMTFEEAAKLTVWGLDAFILMGDTFAFVSEEPMHGGTHKFLLTEKSGFPVSSSS